MQVDDRLLFAFVGAGGDPGHAPGRHMRMERGEQRRRIRRVDVELQVAQRADLLLACAEHDEAARILARLRGHAGHRAQRAPDQRPQQAITLQRACRQARIEDVDRDPAIAAAEQQVRPQLGFQDQRQARAEMVEETPGAARHVVRQVDVVHRVAPQRANPLRSGGGDGGDDPADVRALPAQRIHHRRGGVDLAHRDRVQPHAGPAPAFRIRRIAFVPALEVFAHAEAAPYQVIDGDGQQQVQQGRVQAPQQQFDGILAHPARIPMRGELVDRKPAELHARPSPRPLPGAHPRVPH